jgi:hypothetical protein
MPVWYPAACNQVAMVEDSSKSSPSSLVRTPVWCEYLPVRIEALDGQHRGVFRNALENVIQ